MAQTTPHETDWRQIAHAINAEAGEGSLDQWLLLLQARRRAHQMPASVPTSAAFSLGVELAIAIATKDRKMGRRFEEILLAIADRQPSRRRAAIDRAAKALREFGETGAAQLLEASPEEFMMLFERGRPANPTQRCELLEALLMDE